ncbi:9764_t:CDS:1, partial [Funneliformis caledonium]
EIFIFENIQQLITVTVHNNQLLRLSNPRMTTSSVGNKNGRPTLENSFVSNNTYNFSQATQYSYVFDSFASLNPF